MKTWTAALDDFRTYLQFERKMSPRTVDAYMRDVAQFSTFVEPVQPAEIAREHIG